MSSTELIAYPGKLENVSFRDSDTLIGISVNEAIPVRAGYVLVVELPREKGTRLKLMKAISEALKCENDEEQQ